MLGNHLLLVCSSTNIYSSTSSTILESAPRAPGSSLHHVSASAFIGSGDVGLFAPFISKRAGTVSAASTAGHASRGVVDFAAGFAKNGTFTVNGDAIQK